jgi:hypothetical protein
MRVFCILVLLSSATPAAAQNVYFGNLHAHTSYSDGSGVPGEAYLQARQVGLDFLAISEHNHSAADGKGPRKDGLLIAVDPSLYAGQDYSLVETANRHDDPGKFVALYGQEISTISQGNHINIFEVGAVADVPNGDVPALLAWARAHSDFEGHLPLLQFNHPRDPDKVPKDYGRDDFADSKWVEELDPFVQLIEVLNAPALRDGEGFRAEAKEGYYLEYLNLGFHLGPSVGHDNHWKNWGKSTDARIAVVANQLTRADLLAALRARHTYASDDKNLKVIFRSGENLAGDIVPAPGLGTPLPLTVEISDPDEPNARYRIDVLTDHAGGDRARRPINSYLFDGNADGRLILDGIAADGPGQFVLLKIVQSSAERGDDEHEEQEDRVWTAPIWYEANVAPAILANIRIAAILANPAGNENLEEAVSLISNASTSLDLAQWQLRDASGNVWTLSGFIQPEQQLVIKRLGQAMSLNNGGDTVELIDPAGNVVDSVRYGRAEEGVFVVPQH